MEGLNTSSIQAPSEPTAEAELLDGFRVYPSADPAQCSTRLGWWNGMQAPCMRRAVALVLCGCLGEVLVWARKCPVCLANLEAGLHWCLMCPEQHPVRALRVMKDDDENEEERV